MEWILVALVVLAVVVWYTSRQRRLEREQLQSLETDVAAVRKVADEDITALGEQLQSLDADVSSHTLDEGQRADYQRALDAYETAKTAVAAVRHPDDIRHVTEIVEDGRYAMACVRARIAGGPLPTRRPPCFFDPRHGLSVEDVPYAPPGGTQRDVPACALDTERVRAGADPDVRKVMVGAQRVPYWDGGRAYAPYAAGYFSSFNILPALMVGTMMAPMFSGGMDGSYADGYDAGMGDAGGDGGGDMGGDAGGGDGGGWFDGGGGFDGGDFGGF